MGYSKTFFIGLFVLLVIFTSVSNNSNDNDKSVDAILAADTFWANNPDDIKDFYDSLKSDNTSYAKTLLNNGRVHHIDRKTRVIRFAISDKDKVAKIMFKEGEFRNKTGYVLRHMPVVEYFKE